MIRSLAEADFELPFGINDLNPNAERWDGYPRRVRCYVRGCRHVLQAPTRAQPGDVCPQHGIRCHYSTAGQTYTYADVRSNAIVARQLLATQIVGHPFKYESHRLNYERSEDMLSFNVFRSLQQAGWLHRLAGRITGDPITVEPFLFLWGICLTEDSLEPWDLLVAARERFESNLPVKRPYTEPDIALYLPGRYLILIEAKFTSPNTTYERGPRKDAQSLTLEELLGIYQDPTLSILDQTIARQRNRIFYQLWRNMLFAEWMAKADHPQTKAFHVNLVRKGYEQASAAEFHTLLKPGFEQRFGRITWEQIYSLCAEEPDLFRLRRYMETKTAGLLAAFSLGGRQSLA